MAELRYDSRTLEWVRIADGNIVSIKPKSAPKPKPKRKSKTTRKPKTADEIWAEIMKDPKFGFAKNLVDYMKDMFEIGDVYTVIFRRRRGSCFDGNAKQIVFGYESVNRAFDTGFNEYKIVLPTWTGNGIELSNGMKGVWQLVLHEFAHVLQDIDSGRTRGSIHNENYRGHLDMLITMFPFSECQELYIHDQKA